MPENLTVGGITYNNVDYVSLHNTSGDKVNYYQGLTEEDIAEITETVQANLSQTTPITPQMYREESDADDTPSFQRALEANRVVYVPEGIYNLSDTLIIRENSELELSQSAVLRFSQTDKPCITLLRLASLRGNHATIQVIYEFSSSVINASTADDIKDISDVNGNGNIDDESAVAVPPFTKWDPQWKQSRYVTDINICKTMGDTWLGAYAGFHYSKTGDTSGKAVNLVSRTADYPVTFMWGVSMSGIRIAGAFEYGIYIGNEDKAWNHDMRIEAAMDACKVGVYAKNCNTAHFDVAIQPRKAQNGNVYAEHGIKLENCRAIDLSSSCIWDWYNYEAPETLIASDPNVYSYAHHLALIGECKGLIISDFLYYEQSTDVRELIYTNKSSNLEKMTILQEPFTRWFKPIDREPYFFDGYDTKKLALKSDIDQYFKTDGTIADFEDVKTPYRENIWDNEGTMTAVEKSIYIEPKAFSVNDVVSIKGINFSSVYPGKSRANYYNKSDGTYKGSVNLSSLIANSTSGSFYNSEATYVWNDDEKLLTVTFKSPNSKAYLDAYTYSFGGELASGYTADDVIMTVNKEISYIEVGELSDAIKVKAENVLLQSPNGKLFKLVVNNDGTLSTTAQ